MFHGTRKGPDFPQVSLYLSFEKAITVSLYWGLGGVNLHCQFDLIWSHLGDTLLTVSLKVFPEKSNGGMLILNVAAYIVPRTPVPGQHSPTNCSPRLNKQQKADSSRAEPLHSPFSLPDAPSCGKVPANTASPAAMLFPQQDGLQS